MARRRAQRAPGKAETFDEGQTELLRRLLMEYRKKHALNQDEMGKVLGIGQQSVSKFESGQIGTSWVTASRLAHLWGYAGVDDLFRRHGVYLTGHHKADWLPMREAAAEKLIAAGQIDRALYDEIRKDVLYNAEDHASEDEAFWRATLVTAQRERSKHRAG